VAAGRGSFLGFVDLVEIPRKVALGVTPVAPAGITPNL